MVQVQVEDLYPLAGAASWAISSAIIRRMEYFGSPAQLNFIRTTIGALLFIIHLFLVGNMSSLLLIPTILVVYMVLSVLFNVALGDTLYFASQNRVGVKIATPIVNTYPLFTILIAVMFLDETVSLPLLMGGLVIIIGIIGLSVDRDSALDKEPFQDWTTGLVFALMATLLYALGIIFTTIGTVGLDPITANTVRLPSGAIMLLVLILLQGPHRNISSDQIRLHQFTTKITNASKVEYFALAAAGVLGTYISSLFLVLSVQFIGASRTSILFSTGPFFSLPIAIIWLGEKPGKLTIFGTIATVIGLWIVLL